MIVILRGHLNFSTFEHEELFSSLSDRNPTWPLEQLTKINYTIKKRLSDRNDYFGLYHATHFGVNRASDSGVNHASDSGVNRATHFGANHAILFC